MMPAPKGPPAPSIDLRTIEPLLMAQAAGEGCSWPWLVRFLQALTRADRASARFFPPHHEEGELQAHARELEPSIRGLLDRQDEDLAEAVRRDRRTLHRESVLNGERFFQLATPLSAGGEPKGALMLWIRPPADRSLEPYLVALQLVAGFGQAAAPRGADPRVGESLAALASRPAPQTFVEQALSLTGADAAALAHGGGRWRAVAVSGSERLDPSGALAGAVTAVLRELGQGSDSAQAELSRLWGCQSVKAWRLSDRAAVVLGFRQTRPADLDRVLEAATPGWAALAELSTRVGPGAAMRELARPLATAKWKVVLGVAAVLACVLAWPIPYPIRATARVEAADRRTVSAPADGTLRENLVELGQAVVAGQPLGAMDDAEVRVRLSEVRATRERALAAYASILSDPRADAAKAQLAKLDVEVAEIEIRLLEDRLKRLALTAPVAGTVLRESAMLAGARVPLGMALYEIAPAGAIHLELDVTDSRIAHVREGQELDVLIESFPGRPWRARVTKIHPQSEVRDGSNLFVVEAVPLEPAPEWRPGMRGKATIEGDRRAIGWIVFHPVWEFVEWALF